ncbi:MAG: uroporphyrinogen decarboxylase [Hyphomonadaceae bacterium]|nr:uroporphyrinogen decarboxylase [Hyphomonadaceae bacterium]
MTDGEQLPALLRVLKGERVDPPPIWIMRQAGRYLPEYRELRKRAKTFMDFCYSPALATEAVLQPLRRFPLDAAILFSDILVVPDALGRKVWFVEGEGPRLEPLIGEEVWRFDEPERALQRLQPVYEAVERIKRELDSATPLIGFCGAPWTVATYMLQGEGGDKDRARRCAYERPADVDRLLDTLAEASARHLAEQVRAGADCVQIFESWAEGLPFPLFERLILRPTEKLMTRLRELGVTAPIIGFPRGAGSALGEYAKRLRLEAIGLDTSVAPHPDLPAQLAVQGNLDPQLLVCGGAALEHGVRHVIDSFRNRPHIFNLGHGITPDATPENLSRLVSLVKGAA